MKGAAIEARGWELEGVQSALWFWFLKRPICNPHIPRSFVSSLEFTISVYSFTCNSVNQVSIIFIWKNEKSFRVADIYFEIWAAPPVLGILRRNSKRKVKVKSLSRVQLFTTPWTVARQVSSVHGILQARIPDWVAIPFSRGSSQPRDRTWVSRIESRLFTALGTREVWEQPRCPLILHL